MDKPTHALLRGKGAGYLFIAPIGSNKYFDLLQAEAEQIDMGSYEQMVDMMNVIEDEGAKDLVHLFDEDEQCLIQTTEECLKELILNNPDYLENKQFINL